MIPLKQRFKHNPEQGIYGDCHRAAIASILELSLDEVEHFGHGLPDGEEFDKRVRVYLLSKNLIQINVIYKAELQPILDCVQSLNPNIYYLLGGTSKNGVNHTVVCLNNEIVHDPSIDSSGIIGPCDDGYYWVTFIGSIIGMNK